MRVSLSLVILRGPLDLSVRSGVPVVTVRPVSGANSVRLGFNCPL